MFTCPMCRKELERGTALIVNTLEHMRSLSQSIITATQEQARGNRLYLKSVIEDNERVKKLREVSIQQIMMGDVLLNDIRKSGSQISANSEEAQRAAAEIRVAIDLIEQLQQELSLFSR